MSYVLRPELLIHLVPEKLLLQTLRIVHPLCEVLRTVFYFNPCHIQHRRIYKECSIIIFRRCVTLVFTISSQITIHALISPLQESNSLCINGTNVSLTIVITWAYQLITVVLDIYVKLINTNLSHPWMLLTEHLV